MQLLNALAAGIATLAEFDNLIYLFIGSGLGLVFGAIPGLGALTGMALVLPFTFGMDAVGAMLIYAGIISVTSLGGSLPSIMLNTPGTPQNIITSLDGYPMVCRGEAARAIAVCAASCFTGTIIGVLILLAILPVVQVIILSFRAPEIFWIVVAGMVVLVGVAKDNPIKGLVSAGLGILIANIGWNDLFGQTRFTGGSIYLWDGITIIPFFLGLLAISELWVLGARKGGGGIATNPIGTGGSSWNRQMLRGVADVFRRPGLVVRSAVIGALVGIVPGAGGSVASVTSYAVAKRLSPDGHTYGTGNVEGLIAAEVALDGKEGGALLPTVAFGIPGSPDMAILLGALVMHGLQPGPLLLQHHMDVVVMLILGIVASQIVASFVVLSSARQIALLGRVPVQILVPIVLTLVLAGTYSIRENAWDIPMTIACGFFGIFLKLYNYPLIPIALGYVLAAILEVSYHQTLMMGLGSYSEFTSSWISIVLICGLLALLGWSVLNWKIARQPGGRIGGLVKDKMMSDMNSFPAPDGNRHVELKSAPGGELIFSLLLASMISAALFTSAGSFRESGSIPFVASSVTLIALTILIVKNFGRAETEVEGQAGSSNFFISNMGTSVWLLGYTAAVMIFGFFVSTLLFSFFYLHFRSGLGLVRNIIVTSGLMIFLYVGFVTLMRIELWPGVAPELLTSFVGGGVLPPL